jgi:hypothetical protein
MPQELGQRPAEDGVDLRPLRKDEGSHQRDGPPQERLGWFWRLTSQGGPMRLAP